MNKKLYKLMNWPEIEEIVYADGDAPHRILGAHKVGSSHLVQAFFPGAKEVTINLAHAEGSYPMEVADEEGFFAALIPVKEFVRYSYHVVYDDGRTEDVYDPYNFEPLFDREDVIRFNAGVHYHVYNKFGAHLMTRDSVLGVNFTVWAPNAVRVSVVGAFNGMDGRRHQMTRVDPSGIFELFIPGVKEGFTYQYEIRAKNGTTFLKADPYAQASQNGGAVSVVGGEKDGYKWQDDMYLRTRRSKRYTKKPLSVCEISIDSFAEAFRGNRKTYTYKDMAEPFVAYLKQYGFNALELQPVTNHTVNPFEITSFYSINDSYGTAEDFMAFVDAMHAADIPVILEWTPTFFPETEYGISFFDGMPLYEYGDPAKMRQVKSGYLTFDFGRKQVCNYLISNALYLAMRFHIDGLRFTDISKAIYLDYDRAPGEWNPNVYGGNENLEAIEFIKQINTVMKKMDPGFLMITKETACWPQVTEAIDKGGLGFDYKWNNGWSHDFLDYLRNDPVYRSAHHDALTFPLIYAYTEHYILSFAHEDAEQGYTTIIESMPGSNEMRLANLRLAYSCLYAYPGKKMLFMDPASRIAEEEAQIVQLLQRLNELYASHAALYERDDDELSFEWIKSGAAEECLLTFLRLGKRDKDTLLFVVNTAGRDANVVTGVPYDGKYARIFCSEDSVFGGAHTTDKSDINAVRKDVDGREYALKLTVPALSVTVLKYTPYTMKERAVRKIKEENEYEREKEMEREAQALIEAHMREEERLLAEMKKRHEEELIAQNKAIEEKYAQREAEQIKKAGKK